MPVEGYCVDPTAETKIMTKPVVGVIEDDTPSDEEVAEFFDWIEELADQDELWLDDMARQHGED